MSETELRGRRSDDNLLGRWAEPREVAFPIRFLASDESSSVAGATRMVDAGKSILRGGRARGIFEPFAVVYSALTSWGEDS